MKFIEITSGGRQLLLGGTGLLIGAALGCASPAVEGAGPAIELTVQELEVDRAVVDALGPNGQVRIELLRGPARVPDFTGDFEEHGRYEGDSLVTDSQGDAFLAQFGGHGPLDISWMDRMNEDRTDIDPDQRMLDMELAAEAADMIAVDKRFDVELRRLARDVSASTRVTLHEWQTEGAPTPDVVEPYVPTEGDGLVEKAAALYLHQVYIRWSNCCVGFGQHSATRLRVFDSAGTLMNNLITSNHGDRADAAGMTTVAGCPRSWSNRTNRLPPYQPFRLTDNTMNGNNNAGGCNTTYDAVPPTAGGHVCNDDSLAQYSNVKFNAQMAWGTCNDGTLRTTAPACN